MDFGLFVLGSSKEVSEILGLFLLFAIGFNSLNSPWLFQSLSALRGKSGNLKSRFYSDNFHGNFEVLRDADGSSERSNKDHVKEFREEDGESDHSRSIDDDEDDEELEREEEEDDECDIPSLRKLLKAERRRANAAVAEVAKERAASATAAEEAMAMIQRLQSEKSSIEMESSQYRRLAEEKLIHDQRVIQSLQWLVWSNRNRRDELEEEGGEGLSWCNEDVLENVLYCS